MISNGLFFYRYMYSRRVFNYQWLTESVGFGSHRGYVPVLSAYVSEQGFAGVAVYQTHSKAWRVIFRPDHVKLRTTYR